MRPRLHVQLYEQRDADGSRYVDVTVDEGTVILGCQDLGAAPEKFWGSSEYEFSRTVAAEHERRLVAELFEGLRRADPARAAEIGDPRALPEGEALDRHALALVQALYAGDARAVDHFAELAEAAGIPCEFFSWT